jgi:hypothetical protein
MPSPGFFDLELAPPVTVLRPSIPHPIWSPPQTLPQCRKGLPVPGRCSGRWVANPKKTKMAWFLGARDCRVYNFSFSVDLWTKGDFRTEVKQIHSRYIFLQWAKKYSQFILHVFHSNITDTESSLLANLPTLSPTLPSRTKPPEELSLLQRIEDGVLRQYFLISECLLSSCCPKPSGPGNMLNQNPAGYRPVLPRIIPQMLAHRYMELGDQDQR